MKQPVYIGKDAYINGDMIISIVDSSRPIGKNLKKRAKEEYNLLDFTCGMGTGSVILLNDNHVILSHRTPFQIVNEIREDEIEKEKRVQVE